MTLFDDEQIIAPPLPGPPQRSARERDPRRRLGAFYTSRTTAGLMTEWVLRSPLDRVLEPSFGDGSFLHALTEKAAARGWSGVEAIGVEVDHRPYDQAIARGLLQRHNAIRADFLSVAPFSVDAVLGNPPYVRLRHLSPRDRAHALRVAGDALGVPMQSSGSLWMPFVLHATRFLRPGGRLALALPFELTYVRYARPLWEFLGASFGKLKVLRARERLFPETLQEVVVLLADEKGRTTTAAELEAFETVGDLASGSASAAASIPLERLLAGERAFVEALLPRPLQELLSTRTQELTVPADDLVRFRIGYVTGHKEFFHPKEADATRHDLPRHSLVRAITSTRKLHGAGLHTSSLETDRFEQLFLPADPHNLTRGEAEYVAAGELRAVDRRYKCRVREPWFVVPWVERPDLILSVLCKLPLLMLNDGGFAASNSMLCAYTRAGVGAQAFAASWYTSLTALQCELHVHSLGGGVLVLVPREARRVRVAPVDGAPPGHLGRLDALLRAGRLEDAYAAGDETVLRRSCGLTAAEVSLVEEGAATLRRWRSGRSAG